MGPSSSDDSTTTDGSTDGGLLDRLLAHRAANAPRDQPAPSSVAVWLVGTGPGDPDLLTIKAARLLACADVVLYDRLCGQDVLALCNPAAVMVYVGKARGRHSRTQREIHELLGVFVDQAREGTETLRQGDRATTIVRLKGGASESASKSASKSASESASTTIVRLKGGDPLVFGRGGEEMDYLASRGVDIRVVPGVTAASGICAALGVPQTHRGVASSVSFVTGHAAPAGSDESHTARGESGSVDAPSLVASLAGTDSTACVYMGLQELPSLAAAMLRRGVSESTPCVAVERGTTLRQRVVFSPLVGLAASVAAEGLESPTLVVVGAVVALSPLWPVFEAEGLAAAQREAAAMLERARELPRAPRESSGIGIGTAEVDVSAPLE